MKLTFEYNVSDFFGVDIISYKVVSENMVVGYIHYRELTKDWHYNHINGMMTLEVLNQITDKLKILEEVNVL